METLPQAFEGLRDYPQFILFKYVETAKPGKFDKIPVDYRTMQNHNPLDPQIWMTADDAISRVNALGNSKSGYGVGFTFTDKDPFFFLDIDAAYDVDAGKWSDTATALVGQFAGAAVEVSSSLRGLHILGRGTIPEHRTRDIGKLGLELYHDKRFVALTGIHASGSINFDCSGALQTLVSTHFNLGSARNRSDNIYTETENFSAGMSDEELIQKACNSASSAAAFGSVITFRQLWEGDADALNKYFPKEGGYDASAADFSLASHLAFWTGRDEQRIEKLMRESGLYREKWEREGRFAYLEETIALACSKQSQVYKGAGGTPKTKVLPATASNQTPENTSLKPLSELNLTANNLTGIVSGDQQLTIFAGCVYVLDANEIFTPLGIMLDEKRFNVLYGGMSFVTDQVNSTVTPHAYRAFTQSQMNPRVIVQSTCFKPNFPMGAILNINGKLFVNVYKPPNVRRVKGDPTLFLNHLKKLFPDDTDREIITSYLAALVQMVGVKFQWCPLIQGMQGNGKSILTFIASYCVGRQYCHFPPAKSLLSNFNSWIENKVLIGIEDMYGSRDKMEVMEKLKPMITGEIQGVEGKGTNQTTTEIVANFILNTNHKDALYVSQDDRRLACFFTPQQDLGDLKRDGMTGDYFFNLMNWLKNYDGYAICCEFLSTYPLTEEFKQSLYGRAPLTSSTKESHDISLGLMENTILEAIQEGVTGFKGNFISSHHLRLLLTENGLAKALKGHNVIRSLGVLGYVKHPGLIDGRLNNAIHPDPLKSRLYVMKDSTESKIINPSEIAKAYSKAQSC